MPEFKGTPGPWEIERYSDGLIQIVGDLKVVSDDEESVTTVVEEISAANEANAQLIAAAPELLEALRDLEEAYCDAGPGMTSEKRKFGRKALIAARAALAKALGQ